jgi:epoxyqueuosine reductase
MSQEVLAKNFNFEDFEKKLKVLSKDFGLRFENIIPLKQADTYQQYKSWLEQNYHADMSYLKDHLPIKEDPQLGFKDYKSILSFAVTYPAFDQGLEKYKKEIFKSLRIASYALSLDYHHWLKNTLNALAESLSKEFKFEFRSVTDSAPLLERSYAKQSGLGWVGKNTCLIHPKHGSLFLIGEILTTIVAPEKEISPLPDFCGKCTRCIDICPTKAIEKPYVLNANKCISYWTIESKTDSPIELRSHFGDWLFGCDLCQNVCPWNQKVFTKDLDTNQISNRTSEGTDLLKKELRFILSSSNKSLQKLIHDTPLARTGSLGLKRNAIVVIGNLQIEDLTKDVENYLSHTKLSKLSLWCLNILKS